LDGVERSRHSHRPDALTLREWSEPNSTGMRYLLNPWAELESVDS
jgi:hypothetical protein